MVTKTTNEDHWNDKLQWVAKSDLNNLYAVFKQAGEKKVKTWKFNKCSGSVVNLSKSEQIYMEKNFKASNRIN